MRRVGHMLQPSLRVTENRLRKGRGRPRAPLTCAHIRRGGPDRDWGHRVTLRGRQPGLDEGLPRHGEDVQAAGRRATRG